MSNLGYQMTSAINACTRDGQSKRGFKQRHNGNTGAFVFGLTYKSDLCETAKEMAKFVHIKHPDVKLVKGITPDMVKDYIAFKRRNCSANTVNKIISHIRKIDAILQRIYRSPGFSADLAPVAASDPVRNKTISDPDFDRLIASLKSSRSDVWRSAILSRYAGLRLAETAGVKMERFDPTGGAWGFGTLELKKGDGSKGNRPRIIDIPTQEAREAIQSAVYGRQPGQLIVCKGNGQKYDTRSITRTLSRHIKRLGMDYDQNRSHALRKAFAQSYYDTCRNAGMDRKNALAAVNEQLGHSGNRSDLSKTYVHNQW